MSFRLDKWRSTYFQEQLRYRAEVRIRRKMKAFHSFAVENSIKKLWMEKQLTYSLKRAFTKVQ